MSSLRLLNPMVQQWLRDANALHSFRSEDLNKEVSEWVPNVDIHEEKNAYVLSVEIPGIDPKEIQISAEGNTLTIKGEKKYEKVADEKSFKRIESSYGRFFRQFTLPERVNMNAIVAKAKNGVLNLSIPKLPEHVEKSIKIEVCD